MLRIRSGLFHNEVFSSSDDSNDDTGDAAAIDQRSNPDLEMAVEETNTRPMSYEVDE